MNVFPKLFLVLIFYVNQSLVWGKTAVFVLATLQQLEPVDGNIFVLVMCHTRELAFQISKEYERFSKYMPTVKVINK